MVQIEILHRDIVGAARPIKFESRRTQALPGASDRFPTRSRLPGSNLYRGITGKLHVLGFHAMGMETYPTLRIRNSRFLMEPVHHRVAPDDGVPGLIFLAPQDLGIARIIDQAIERFPLL